MTGWLLSLLRVPPEPHPPDGTPESIRIFRAGKNYYRWRLLGWGSLRVMTLIGGFLPVVFLLFATKLPPLARTILTGVEVLYVVGWLGSLPISYLMQRLNYELRWYIVTDRSLRIRDGIWSVEEITMTFANIQDINITQGPIQGWLGLADVEVSSAGGGSTTAGQHGASVNRHQATFAGVDNAEEIRELIVERLRRYRDAGLGDPGAPAPVTTTEEAAAELLAEARLLRKAVS